VQRRKEAGVVNLGWQDRQISGVIALLPRRHQHDVGRVRLRRRDALLQGRQIERPLPRINKQKSR
jgi:hypothetical protein